MFPSTNKAVMSVASFTSCRCAMDNKTWPLKSY